MNTWDWKAYHEQRAADYRKIADSWRKTAEEFNEQNQDLAAFAIHRANINDEWAKEEDWKAKYISEKNQPTSQ